MNGVQTKVVGVMSQDFFFQDRKNSDYWVPMAFTPKQWARRQTHFLTVVARLKPGVTAPQGQEDIEQVGTDPPKQESEANAEGGGGGVASQKKNAGGGRGGVVVRHIASPFLLL